MADRTQALIDALRAGTLKPGDPWYNAATAALQQRQDAASAARYDKGDPVVTGGPGSGSPNGSVYGALSGGDGGAAAAAAAQAAATASANTSAKSSANQNKTALQQAIDAAFAQKSTNQAKLDALTKLVGEGLASARDTKLTGVSNDLKLLLDQAMANYTDTLGDVNTGLRSNEKAEADASFGNLANRAREKMDLVSQALSQGAGESDVLRSQLQALRNWDANQGEVNRSFFDTLNSTNATLTDLNVGTKSNMTGYEMDANQRKSSVWDDFYSTMSDSYTQMDNLATNNYLLDQEIGANQANLQGQDALLAWLNSGKNASDYVAPTTATGTPSVRTPYDGFADEAADWARQAWTNPGVSTETQNWKGQEAQDAQLNSSNVLNAQTNTAAKGAVKKKPEGATLRRW
jgi:hypothetical protein